MEFPDWVQVKKNTIELEEYSIYSVYSTSESGIGGRTGTVVISFRWALDFYSGIEWFLFHLKWNRWRSECLFQLFFFLKSLKRNAVLVNNSFKTWITAFL